jgi:predicted DNA-binding transcriptional regulator AlpA
MTRLTYNATEVSKLFGLSEWAVYQHVKAGDFPIAPIHVGRRLLWPCAPVDALLAGEAS